MPSIIHSRDDGSTYLERPLARFVALWLCLISTCAIGLAAPHPRSQVEPPLAKAEALAAKLLKAGDNDARQALIEEMMLLALDDSPSANLLESTVRALDASSSATLGSKGTAKTFAPLLKARAKIDAVREPILALIRDTDRYPYPFSPEDATPESIAKYQGARKSIQSAENSLNKLWKRSPKVRMPSAVMSALELRLLLRQMLPRMAAESNVKVELPARGYPVWVEGLPFPGELKADSITLQNFALTRDEGRIHAEAREIARLNQSSREGQLAAAKDRNQRKEIESMFDQVDVTNAYRRLLGLHALAWDPRLQAACDQHAEYIVETGDFGHFQPDPDMKDFMVRAKKAGYSEMVFENCHKGSNHPEAAHRALSLSTEHHRNMLQDVVFEMATSKRERIWVQNFGQEASFRDRIELHGWWK